MVLSNEHNFKTWKSPSCPVPHFFLPTLPVTILAPPLLPPQMNKYIKASTRNSNVSRPCIVQSAEVAGQTSMGADQRVLNLDLVAAMLFTGLD